MEEVGVGVKIEGKFLLDWLVNLKQFYSLFSEDEGLKIDKSLFSAIDKHFRKNIVCFVLLINHLFRYPYHQLGNYLFIGNHACALNLISHILYLYSFYHQFIFILNLIVLAYFMRHILVLAVLVFMTVMPNATYTYKYDLFFCGNNYDFLVNH